MKQNVMEILSRFAAETLNRLHRFEGGDVQVDIFANQPKWFQKKIGNVPKPTRWIIGHIQSQSNYNDLRYNQENFSNVRHKLFTEWLEKYFQSSEKQSFPKRRRRKQKVHSPAQHRQRLISIL